MPVASASGLVPGVGESATIGRERERERNMEKIPLEVLKAVKTMNEEKFLSAMLEGNAAQAGESLKRMTYALSQIEQYNPLCGDHIRPISECGCRP